MGGGKTLEISDLFAVPIACAKSVTDSCGNLSEKIVGLLCLMTLFTLFYSRLV